jgi:hypothetical protein
MRHACVAQAAAGQPISLPAPVSIQNRLYFFSVKLLSDALLEFKYLQIYLAKFSEFGIVGKLMKISIQPHWFQP